MTINLGLPETQCLKPRITVIGVGGAGGNAVNNMIASGLNGVDFVVANTDAQALAHSHAERRIQLGVSITQGLGAGSRPDIGKAAAEEALDEIMSQLVGSHMVFVTAGLGGGTGTGATPVVARAAREQGMLTVGVVTKPFHFEGGQRMRLADEGLRELQQFVDTLIIIPNQNLFRIANDKTTFADAFKLADDVLHAGVRGVTDLMVQPGLINLDFADVRTVMSEMGKAMMGTGEADGDRRALEAAEAAIANPLLDEVSMKGAKGVLINITGGSDMTLFEVDEAANRIREEVDPDANIIFGAAFDESMQGRMRVSLVATGIEAESMVANPIGRPALTAIPGGQAQRVAQAAPAAMPVTARVGQHALALDSRQAEPQAIRVEAVMDPAPEPVAVAPRPAPVMAQQAMAHAQPAMVQQAMVQHAVAQPAMAQAMPAAAPVAQLVAAAPALQAVPHAFSFLGRAETKAEAQPEQARTDAFIPEAPVEAPRKPVVQSQQADAFGAAALANNGARESRKPSLFERMTGRDRYREPARHEPEIQPAAAARPQPAQPRPAPQPAPQPAPRVEARMEVEPVEDDVLDIPAFLRRQAN